MPNLLWICLELTLVGVSSFGIAYAIQKWKSSFHRVAPPRPSTIFRLTTGSAYLRARLESSFDRIWRFDPPVSASGEFVLKAGQTVAGEYPSSTGLLRFRSEILEVEESGQFSIRVPQATKSDDRREEPRQSGPGEVLIEKKKSACIDLSPLGGRFETDYRAKRGERIRLDFPRMEEPIFGWVLETYPNQIRVRFEERLPYFK